MSIRVIHPGLLTSVQDSGRFGFQKYGVIASGAMDPFAHRTANLLVGNEETEATLEMTLKGAIMEFREAALISICGGDLSPSVEGIPVPLWKPIYLKKGSILHFGYCRSGARAYLAIAGGWSVPRVMDSRSTYLRAGIGGFQGRGLRAGDELASGEPTWLGGLIADQLAGRLHGAAFATADWGVTGEMLPPYSVSPCVRVMRGNQWDWFTEESRRSFLSEPYRVTPQSDRMGYRLDGPLLELIEQKELISEAVAFGTVQVPPEGKPIVLLADRQTTGGYPKIAQVATVDLPLMAQTKPGETLRFAEISREEAERLLMARENEIRQLKTGILLKYT
ncbi:biotin-dependent carboxyltransferase family protein [Brevibacillus massiliensis]|uniref:5-oxoprolinase subunit C family protein n=1 Tax=Brevibacillus massiliensis TaxID=1118054 RepID=UPI000474BDFF|nr:biotin-dependent carboxyltransferase family protein [Brevibacillus massiliensis]